MQLVSPVSRATCDGRLRARLRRGFTLIEAALTTVIVGVGVVSMLRLLAAGTSANSDATELTTALNLAGNIHELSQTLAFQDPGTEVWGHEAGETLATYNDVWDLNGFTSTSAGPIDAHRAAITNMPAWQQQVTVSCVDPNGVTTGLPNGASAFARVTVVVRHNAQEVCRISWLVVNTDTGT